MSSLSHVNFENESVVRILRAATRCFAERGYAGASMNAIAQEAGVSKSLVHYHFDSKEHLFVGVMLHMLKDLLARVQRLSATSQQGTIESMTAVLDTAMRWVEREIHSLRVLIEFSNVSTHNTEVATHLTRFNEQVEAALVGALAQTLGPSIERLVIPPARVIRLVRTLFNGLILELAYAPAGHETHERIRETFSDCKTILTRAIMRPVQ